MTMTKTQMIVAMLCSTAFQFAKRMFGGFNASPLLGAAALPVVPTSGDTNPATLAVATAIKPTETIGSAVEALLQNKPSSDDHKVVVLVGSGSKLARLLLFPSSVATGTILSGETKVATVERDDTTKATSSHSLTAVSGHETDEHVESVAAALEEVKPKRSMASLVNAMFDSMLTEEGVVDGSIALVIDQTGDGKVELYDSASAGTLTGKVADITQENAEAAPGTPSLW